MQLPLLDVGLPLQSKRLEFASLLGRVEVIGAPFALLHAGPCLGHTTLHVEHVELNTPVLGCAGGAVASPAVPCLLQLLGTGLASANASTLRNDQKHCVEINRV